MYFMCNMIYAPSLQRTLSMVVAVLAPMQRQRICNNYDDEDKSAHKKPSVVLNNKLWIALLYHRSFSVLRRQTRQ